MRGAGAARACVPTGKRTERASRARRAVVPPRVRERVSGPPRRALASLAAAASIATSGCFSPAFSDGQFSCGPNEACPPGFACDRGACVRTPGVPPGGDAAAPEIDAALPAPDAAAPDAAAPPGAAVYRLGKGDAQWTRVDAEEFFAGAGAPAPDDIRSAWAICDFRGDMVCVGTATEWRCSEDAFASWFGAPWDDIPAVDSDFALTPPTIATAFDQFDAGIRFHQVWFGSGDRWWVLRYARAPERLGGDGGKWELDLETAWDDPDQTVRSVEWAGVPNAPPGGDVLVADHHRGDTWHVWTADGTEYRLDVTGAWLEPRMAPDLALPGAPPGERIVETARCRDTLYAFVGAGP
ncbi:MAG: hypothetical protein D6689_13835 [Deltaproteobacteria bacterium]|nr:MAG: hypothetical protein D6689_13835 [Deltaproteobacteria bacterium]